MPSVVEKNEATYPSDVSVLGAATVVARERGLGRAVEGVGRGES